MSFSSGVRAEILNAEIKPTHCNLAFLSAILYTTDFYSNDKYIQFYLENQNLGLFIKNIIKRFFDFEADLLSENKKFSLKINNAETVKNIFSATGYNKDKRLNMLIIKKDCCKKYFLAAAFLTSGSVSDPNKAYHLEFDFRENIVADIVSETMNYFGLSSKIIKRKSNYIVYLKDGDQIVDMLNIIGAHKNLLEFENIRVFKNVRNNVNRAVNCETFNLRKSGEAAGIHISNIEFIIQTKGLSFLSDELQEVANVRLEYPECTLKEIGEKLKPPLSKSCINHRLRKISNIADSIRGGL